MDINPLSFRPTVLSLSACLLLAVTAASAGGAREAKDPGGIRPTALRCESSVNPLGIDARQPRLAWELEHARVGERRQSQTAYQILVASTEGRLRGNRGDLWDSGKVEHPQGKFALQRSTAPGTRSLDIAYGGTPLQSRQRVYWKVRVWDAQGRPSEYSAPAWWEMALLRPEDWQGSWISRRRVGVQTIQERFGDDPAPLLRREFTVGKKLRRARASIAGLGYYELRLNGQRVGDHVLDPGWTDYRKRVLYSTYDVTSLLKTGGNAVGIMLGNGWYNPLPLPLFGRFDLRNELLVGEPRAILQLDLEYEDGTTEAVVTDENWKAAPGPIIRNSVYLGEHYDARKEQAGWDRPGFSREGWESVVLADRRQRVGPLQAQFLPPIRATRALRTVKVTEPKPGVFVCDLGQNFAGWARLRARGPAGTKITLRYGELIYPDGTLNPMTAVMTQIKNRRQNAAIGAPETAWQTDSYTLRGEGEEVYTPRFTFHGFRYVELTGFPGRPDLGTIEGLLLHSDVESAGEFSCSNPMFNRLQEVVRWTQLSNMFSVQSDCPHREKLGYGGDIVAASEMGILNFDMARFYRKAVLDLADAQRPNGGFTETAPYVGIADEGLGEGAGPIGWGTAHPLLVWQLYQYYGDRQTLQEQWPRVERWVAFLKTKEQDGILDNGISDHESLVPKPRALTGTGFYYLNLRLAEWMTAVLGRGEQSARYGADAERVKAAFNRRFLTPGAGKYDSGTQACQAFALHLELVPDAEKQAALDHLVRDITQTHKGHLSTGIFGTKYMLRALTDLGRADVAYTVADQRTFPGWGHMLENGATTLWEHWAFSDNVYSHNHPMFGSVSEWFFRALAGINPDAGAEGFNRVVIRPQPVAGLDWAKGRYRSARGPVLSEWRKANGRLTLTVELPPGVSADVWVPARPADVLEGGAPAEKATGVSLHGTAGGTSIFTIGSGRYTFTAPLP